MLHPLLSLTLVFAQLLLSVTPLYRCHRADGATDILVGGGCRHEQCDAQHAKRCCQPSISDQKQSQKRVAGVAVSRRPCVDIPIAHGQLARPENNSANAATFPPTDAPMAKVDGRDARARFQSLAAEHRRDDGTLYALSLVVLRC